MILSEVLAKLDGFWPVGLADDWDRPGLSTGDPKQSVTKVLVSVDITHAVIDEAIASQCELIVTHHPMLLRGLTSVTDDQLKGSLVSKLIRSCIATFSAHTNADIQSDGASTLMAKRFGLSELKPLVNSDDSFGHGVVGKLAQPMRLEEFASVVSSKLETVARKVVFAGDPKKQIQTAAICSGAGDGFLPVVLESSADVYVTSDLRHHLALDALDTPRSNGSLALIDVSHWASEVLWVDSAIERLHTIDSLEVIRSSVITDPWTAEVN